MKWVSENTIDEDLLYANAHFDQIYFVRKLRAMMDEMFWRIMLIFIDVDEKSGNYSRFDFSKAEEAERFVKLAKFLGYENTSICHGNTMVMIRHKIDMAKAKHIILTGGFATVANIDVMNTKSFRQAWEVKEKIQIMQNHYEKLIERAKKEVK